MAPGKPKTARYTEIERKFAVTENTVSPSFEGLSAVAEVVRSGAQHLDAVYFDTPDRDLAAHRITLRRRTGGSDAGWHLKLPAGPDTRTEVRAPLGSSTDTVPEDLRDIVLAIVRDRPLAPVARISTERRIEVLHGPDGTALAEFCDDRVTASATGPEAEQQSWREWELELLPADVPDDLMDRLANRLADAGAEPAGHGSKLAKVLGTDTAPAPEPPADPVHRAIAEQIDELLVWDRAVRADAYDSVHQMRVTTRKLRSLLQESKESFGLDDENGWVLDELRALAAVLGVARDAEVLAERYQRALDELPAELIRGPVRQRLVEGANRRYTSGWRRSLLAMRSQRYFRLLDALEELVRAEPPKSADGSHASVNIDAAYKRVRKAAKNAEAVAADDVSAEEKDEALHRIRKGAKRLRYTAAATGADKVSDRAKTIQTLLGDHQDSVVSKAHLSTQADAAHAAGEDTFTYGLLYQQEHDTAQQSRASLQDALKKLDKAVRKAH
ncbi:CYTH and CHAD domain-containing protein [Mycolicibacterium houstonense]|uniref:CYTH and CHAD domain-containing protein n=1 Tax=Mycolicibacterium houstonense TaxID=146021 RepID=UPI000834AD64|nr:CYTH and CHAD domain-containing protein [Mycolicibacterium houstonense]